MSDTGMVTETYHYPLPHEDLRPCPQCPAYALVHRYPVSYRWELSRSTRRLTQHTFTLFCAHCLSQTPPCATLGEAMAAWNAGTRELEPALRK